PFRLLEYRVNWLRRCVLPAGRHLLRRCSSPVLFLVPRLVECWQRTACCCATSAAGASGVVDFNLLICTQSPDLVDARSAIVSNVVLVAAVTLLMLLSAGIWCGVAKTTLLKTISEVFLLPSSLFPIVMSAIPSTTVATTLIIANVGNSTCILVDVALLVLGILFVASPLAGYAWLRETALGSGHTWSCKFKSDSVVSPGSSFVAELRVVVRRVARRQWKWHATEDADYQLMRRAWVVLLEFRVLWYGAADVFFLVVVSLLAVASGLDVGNEALCRGCSAAAVALLSAQVTVLCVWRPYTTLFSLVYNVLTTALTCVSVAAQLAFVMTSFTSTSGLWLVDMSAVCNLLVLGLSVVKMVFDGWELWSAVKRRMEAACRCDALVMNSIISGENTAVNQVTKEAMIESGDVTDLPSITRLDMQSHHVDGADSSFDDILLFDGIFWDDKGKAIGTSETDEMNELLTTVVNET
ncbi:membrane-associated protein, putative, partial [Bodo saltans]